MFHRSNQIDFIVNKTTETRFLVCEKEVMMILVQVQTHDLSLVKWLGELEGDEKVW